MLIALLPSEAAGKDVAMLIVLECFIGRLRKKAPSVRRAQTDALSK